MNKTFLWLVAAVGSFAVLVGVVLSIMAVSSYNGLVSGEEAVKAQWAHVQAVYQRRLDLLGNAVETVKGYAAHEKNTLLAVAEARAKVGAINVSGESLQDPTTMQRFEAAQASLSGAMQRLLMVSEQYPQLKADQQFTLLITEIEGSENRISVERRRYNEAVQAFNTDARSFPTMIFAGLMGFKTFIPFQASQEAQNAPQIKF